MPIPLLMTGFTPFLKYPFNSSWDGLARMMAIAPDLRERVAVGQISTAYGKARGELAALIERHQPRAILSLGMHGGPETGGRVLRAYYVEEVAYNNCDTERPDIDGEVRQGVPIEADAPLDQPLDGTLDPAALAAAFSSAGVDALLSRDPGRYLCNYVFHCGVRLGAALQPPVPAGFVHVPPHSGIKEGAPDLDEMAAVYAMAARRLAA